MLILRDSSEISSAIKSRHLRAARALLGWSQGDLAKRAGLVRRTITWIETDRGQMRPVTMEKIVSAFASAGVVFDMSGRGSILIGDQTEAPAKEPTAKVKSVRPIPSRSSA